MDGNHMILTLPCPKCNGTGTWGRYEGTPPEWAETSCVVCGEDGRIESWRLSDSVPSASWTFRVLECVDPAEYAALSAANKSILSMILSCGIVDLSAGTAARTFLADMFGAGTTTRAALVDLLAE